MDTTMKKSIICIVMACMAICAFAEKQVTQIHLWKNGEPVTLNVTGGSRLIANDSAYYDQIDVNQGYLNIQGLGMGLMIDSIVWHPYALQSVYVRERDTLPVVTTQGEKEYSVRYPLYLQPDYATFTCNLVNSDTTVARVSLEQKTYNEARRGMGGTRCVLSVTPLKEGKTTFTLTFNNKIEKQFEVVVTPRPGVQDETSISTDSLYNKIYSRLVHTGNVLPSGYADIQGEDEGSTGFYKDLLILQELCADQLYYVWSSDPGISQIVGKNFNPDNSYFRAFYHRLYYNIWMCNSYLTRTEGQADLATKRAEVRFLRAYFYYHLLDMFGNVPVVTDNTLFTTTAQSTRLQVFDFVKSELLTAVRSLPQTKEDYYRIDQAAAWLLLSRLYLNSEVYTGTADYDNAVQYAYNVIQSSYGLATNYKWLFMGDNDKRSMRNDAYKEIIFPVRQEGASTASWCGSLWPIAIMYSNEMPSVGVSENWAGVRSTTQLVDLFFADPAGAIGGTADNLTVAAGDDRARFCNQSYGSVWEYNGGNDFYGGWAIQKWSNLMADTTYVQSDRRWPDTDIPLMRKAEAYLNYAEAVLRGGQALSTLSAKQAVNALRSRANAEPLKTVTLDDILDERGREFYAEGYRRSDLIRFGKFGGNKLYPIPANYLPGIPNGVQNEGY